MPGEMADQDAMRWCDNDESWEERAMNELGLSYFPRRLDPAVRRELIRLYRLEQLKELQKLAIVNGLFND